MSVIINYKICSNMRFCNVLKVCPTGAVYWDEEAKRLQIDNTKCIACGACARICPIAAIKIYKNQAELEKIQAEIDADPHREEDLLVDRYVAGALQTPILMSDRVEKFVAETDGLVCIELNPPDEDLVCNVQAIPISEIMDLGRVTYRACEDGWNIADKFSTTAPALVFFRDGVKIGAVSGFFEDNPAERGLLKKKVSEILE